MQKEASMQFAIVLQKRQLTEIAAQSCSEARQERIFRLNATELSM